MIFTEQKIEDTYHYEVEDVFGKIKIDSPVKVKPNTLDMIVVYVMRMNQKELLVEVKDYKIKTTYERREQWEDDNSGEDPEVGDSI